MDNFEWFGKDGIFGDFESFKKCIIDEEVAEISVDEVDGVVSVFHDGVDTSFCLFLCGNVFDDSDGAGDIAVDVSEDAEGYVDIEEIFIFSFDFCF